MHLYSRDYFISQANTIAVEKRENQSPFAIHCHEFNELVIVSAGNGVHIWNDAPYPITCGDIIYINPQDQHGYESVNNLKLNNILYHRHRLSISSIIENYLPGLKANEAERFWRISPSHTKTLEPLIYHLQIESKKPNLLSIHYAETLFSQLVILLYRFRFQPDRGMVGKAQQLNILLMTLRRTISTPFNLEQFCLKHNIASRSLHRLFKAKTGMTITGYLQKLRLCEAMRLLRLSHDPISVIAAKCGYNDSNYFSFVFHKETHLTPTDYRHHFMRQSK